MKIQSVVLFVCALVGCSYGTEKIQVSVGVAEQTTGLVYIVNSKTNHAYAVETSTGDAAVFDGDAGKAVYYCTSSKTGAYVKASAWLASKKTIQSYLSGCKSLKTLIQSNTYTEIAISTFDQDIFYMFADTLGNMAYEIKVGCEQSALEMGFAYFLAITDNLCTSLSGSKLLTLFKSTPTKCDGGIVWLTYVFKGLTKLFATTQFALDDYIGVGVSFNMTTTLGSTNGIACLDTILKATQKQMDLGIVLGDTLNDLEIFFEITSLLGGKAIFGISGIYSTLAATLHYINGNGELEAVNAALIKFSLNASATIDSLTPISNIISTLQTSSKTYGTSVDITALIALLKPLVDKSCTHSNIGLSNIVTLLEKGAVDCSPAELAVNVLIELESLSQVYESIPQLILTGVRVYNNTNLYLPNTFNCTYDTTQTLLETVIDTVATITETVSNTLTTLLHINAKLIESDSENSNSLGAGIDAVSNAVCHLSEGKWNVTKMLRNCTTKPVYKEIRYWVKLYLGASVDTT